MPDWQLWGRITTTNTRHNNASWYGGSFDQWIGNAASTTWSTTSDTIP